MPLLSDWTDLVKKVEAAVGQNNDKDSPRLVEVTSNSEGIIYIETANSTVNQQVRKLFRGGGMEQLMTNAGASWAHISKKEAAPQAPAQPAQEEAA